MLEHLIEERVVEQVLSLLLHYFCLKRAVCLRIGLQTIP